MAQQSRITEKDGSWMLRRGIINLAALAYAEAAMNPDLTENEGQRLYALADDLDKTITRLVTVVTNSSSSAYAESDLPAEERADLKKYRHALKILRSMYGLQSA